MAKLRAKQTKRKARAKRKSTVRKPPAKRRARKTTVTRRTRKAPARKSTRRYLIEALSISGRMNVKYFFWTGKTFSDVKSKGKKFSSSSEAWKSAREMLGRLPQQIRTLRVVPA